MKAAPRIDGRPHFERAVFVRTSFGDGCSFGGASFGDGASFRRATFGNDAFFEDRATFGHDACFDRATFGDRAGFGGATFGDRAGFGEATFGMRASFLNATFGDKAFFGGATFGDRAILNAVTFGDGASFRGAALEGASLVGTSLVGIRLNRARFDYRSSLERTRLFTIVDGDGVVIKTCPPWLGDVRWNGVQVTGVEDWGSAKEVGLGDDPDVMPVESEPAVSESVNADIRADALNAAIRAHRQVGALLDGQGMREVAQDLDFRASQLARRQQKGVGNVILWWALDRLTGYGYRPGRVLITYGVVVASFALLYGWTGTTSWENAAFASLLAFHGCGISASDVVVGRLDVILPSIEAALGLFVEALVVAVIIRRLFRR